MGQFFSWGITIFIIRLLSPSDYGLMAMATIFLELVIMISQLGLGYAIIQSPTIREQELAQLLGFIVIINFSGCILTFLGAPFVSNFFNEPRLIPILKVLSMTFFLRSLYVLPESLLLRNLDFPKKVSIDLFGRIIGVL
ncbi:MAG: oligosaccharide flippase family protein, partial [Candidatus Hodarchaeota archaeon]